MFPGSLAPFGGNVGRVSKTLSSHAPLNDLLEAYKSAATDEQDISRIDLIELLVGMFSATLRGNIGDCSFENLQQRLLDAFSRNISRNRRIFILSRNLIYFIDVDNSLLSLFQITVGVLKELQNDIFDIFPNVTSLGQAS